MIPEDERNKLKSMDKSNRPDSAESTSVWLHRSCCLITQIWSIHNLTYIYLPIGEPAWFTPVSKAL